jgi:tetratricopeptide (TPR) repeat protein
MFQALRGWFDRRRAFRELRAIEGHDNHAYAGYFSDQLHLAKASFDNGAKEKSLRIWREMHMQYPDLSLTSAKALSLLIDLGRHDEAEALVKEGLRRYPRYKTIFAAAFARIAYRRGDLDTAIARCEDLRRRFPRLPDGYSIAADCLTDKGRPADAEELLSRGVGKIPNDVDLCMRYAQAAVRRQDWKEGLKRWKTVWERFEPTSGLLGEAECLTHMERYDEADTILIEACDRFSMNAWPFCQWAELPAIKGDISEAVRRWHFVLDRFPGFEHAYPKAVATLRGAGQETEADEVLRVGVTRFPEDLAINLEYARSAHKRRDWTAAVERWTLVRHRFPDCAEAREQQAVAMAAVEGQGAPPG